MLHYFCFLCTLSTYTDLTAVVPSNVRSSQTFTWAAAGPSPLLSLTLPCHRHGSSPSPTLRVTLSLSYFFISSSPVSSSPTSCSVFPSSPFSVSFPLLLLSFFACFCVSFPLLLLSLFACFCVSFIFSFEPFLPPLVTCFPQRTQTRTQ